MDGPAEKLIIDAAKYFREEVLEIMPDIPPEELSGMVSEYVYYHRAETTKSDALLAGREACLQFAR